MKLKGIWIVIAVICIAGIGITNYSMSHFSSGEPAYVSKTLTETYQSTTDEAAALETQITEADQKEAGKIAAAPAHIQTDAADEETGSEILEDSGIPLAAEIENSSEQKDIMKELAELDDQVQTMKALSVSKTTSAMKAEAEAERKIWENKMQAVLEILEKKLSDEERDLFFAKQRSWIRDRENTAVANSKRQNGSALEELEYIRSLRDLTREHVYQLAEHYESVLNETE